MDPYKRLCIEYGGIKAEISRYKSRGNIRNYLDQLEKAIDVVDGEAIIYCLNEIDRWYKENISSIRTNEFVTNLHEHNNNIRLISSLLSDFEGYDFSVLNKEAKANLLIPRILLSHSSFDKKYADAIEKLLTSIGVSNEQLIYSSHPLHKIPLGENIYEYLREIIGQQVYVIFLLSNKYLDSPACLNEMGASWVAKTDYVSLFTPDFDFSNPKFHKCAIDIRKMGAVLNGDANCKASMIELRNVLSDFLGITVEEQLWTVTLDQFIEDLKAIDRID